MAYKLKTENVLMALVAGVLIVLAALGIKSLLGCSCVKEAFDNLLTEGIFQGIDNVTRYGIKDYGTRHGKVNYLPKVEEPVAADAIRFPIDPSLEVAANELTANGVSL